MPQRKLDQLSQTLEPLFKVLRAEAQDSLPDVVADEELLDNQDLLQFQDAVPTWFPSKLPEWSDQPSRPWKNLELRQVLLHQIRSNATRLPSEQQPLTASELVSSLRRMATAVILQETSILESS